MSVPFLPNLKAVSLFSLTPPLPSCNSKPSKLRRSHLTSTIAVLLPKLWQKSRLSERFLHARTQHAGCPTIHKTRSQIQKPTKVHVLHRLNALEEAWIHCHSIAVQDFCNAQD
eukprot:1161525-Pelagomonas_calceolata.AAC.20